MTLDQIAELEENVRVLEGAVQRLEQMNQFVEHTLEYVWLNHVASAEDKTLYEAGVLLPGDVHDEMRDCGLWPMKEGLKTLVRAFVEMKVRAKSKSTTGGTE